MSNEKDNHSEVVQNDHVTDALTREVTTNTTMPVGGIPVFTNGEGEQSGNEETEGTESSE